MFYYYYTEFATLLVLLQVHLELKSSVPDHCRVHSLSDPRDCSFQATCDHEHDLDCQGCRALDRCLEELEDATKTVDFPSDTTKGDILYRLVESRKAVVAWKEHQMRSVHQDHARTKLLQDLPTGGVHITQDWAMKFMPRKYRESQTEWFGKRGISWHITECTLRDHAGTLQSVTYVHIVENCTQDNTAVTAIMLHVLSNLKAQFPHLHTAFYRSDNAGCYHSAATLAAVRTMAATGISVRRLDFSAPQNGKGPCDRRAAILKSYAKRHLNEGNDIVSGNYTTDSCVCKLNLFLFCGLQIFWGEN